MATKKTKKPAAGRSDWRAPWSPDKFRRFAALYLQYGVATRAYIETTGSQGNPATVNKCAHEKLHDPRTQEALTKLRNKAADLAATSLQEWISNELKIARFDIGRLFDADGHLLDLQDMDADTRAAIVAIDIEDEKVSVETEGDVVTTRRTRVKRIKGHSKDGSQDRLARYLGAYEKDNDQQNPVMRLVEMVPAEGLATIEELLREFISTAGDGGEAHAGRAAAPARSGK